MSDRLPGSCSQWLYLLFLLPMALAAWQLLFDTRVQTDMSAFMPRAQGQTQQLLLQQLEQGTAARLWMLTLAHAPPEVLADISNKLAHKASESPLVNHVMNGNMMLDEAARDQLFEYRFLLSDRVTSNSFSQQGLRQMFEDLLQTLRSPLSTFSKELFQPDPGGEFLHLLQSFSAGSSGPGSRHGVWFNKQNDKALLLLESRASGTDLDAQLELRRQLSFWLDELTEGGVPDQSITLGMGGVPLISLETREQIRQTSQRLSVAASVFMLAFMFFVYRRLSKVLLTALPLLSGVLMGAACVSWWFGSIHGITLAFGITLLGVAVDYPVHLLSHQRKQERLGQTAVRIWPTLALSVLSTVLGFSAMLWTDFPGLAQLGMFSVCGLLTAALVTRYLLPLWAGSPASSIGRVDKRTAHPPIYLSNLQIGGRLKLLLGLFLILGVMWLNQGKDLWSRDIQALSPVPAEVRLADQQMRQLMGAPEPSQVMLLTAGSVQQLLEKQEQIQSLLSEAVARGYVGHVDYAARIVPSEKLQLQRRLSIPKQEQLEKDLEQVLGNLPLKPDSFAAFVMAVENSRQLLPMTPDRLVDSVLLMRFNSLLQQTRQGVNGLIQLVDVHDAHALADLMQVSSRDDLWLLDVPGATSELVDQFREEVMHKAVLGLVLIGGLVALWLKNPLHWLRVMLPVLLSVAVSVTVVLATGASLNLFHLISLLLVAGIGLDYALFFARSQAGTVAWNQTAYALTVCCTSTVVVFSLLAASDIPVLHAIGLTVASGTLAAFVLSWVFSRDTVQVAGAEDQATWAE